MGRSRGWHPSCVHGLDKGVGLSNCSRVLDEVHLDDNEVFSTCGSKISSGWISVRVITLLQRTEIIRSGARSIVEANSQRYESFQLFL